jgi:hypothetical protein
LSEGWSDNLKLWNQVLAVHGHISPGHKKQLKWQNKLVVKLKAKDQKNGKTTNLRSNKPTNFCLWTIHNGIGRQVV